MDPMQITKDFIKDEKKKKKKSRTLSPVLAKNKIKKLHVIKVIIW